eukprot:sb/3475189/
MPVLDQEEINVFFEIADTMNEKLISDRLKDFRNVIFSIRPLLFDLTPTSSFKDFQEACSQMISRASETEGDVAAKLEGVARNLAFFQDIKEAQLDTSKTAISMIQKLERSGQVLVEVEEKEPEKLFDQV